MENVIADLENPFGRWIVDIKGKSFIHFNLHSGVPCIFRGEAKLRREVISMPLRVKENERRNNEITVQPVLVEVCFHCSVILMTR